jgi:hypothetical protein
MVLPGNPSKAFRYALKHEQVLLSLELLEELSDVLGREKFNRFVTSTAAQQPQYSGRATNPSRN